MINSRKSLEYYLTQDCLRNMKVEKPGFLSYYLKLFCGRDSAKAYRYMKVLRKYEYAINCCSGSLWGNLRILYRKFVHSRLSAKYDIVIGPNMVGPGFWMSHINGGGYYN